MTKLIATSLCLALIGGCAVSESPKQMTLAPIFVKPKTGNLPAAPSMAPIAKFGDNYWVVIRDFKYRILSTDKFVVVPAGFVTDLASIPRVLWPFGLSPIDTYMTPAIIHDYLYWDQRCTKEEADAVLGLAMVEAEVSPAKRIAVYRGVDWFGQSSYSKNASLKRKSETRFITPGFLEVLFELPMPASTDLLKILQLARERDSLISLDTHNPDIKSFCAAALAEYKG